MISRKEEKNDPDFKWAKGMAQNKGIEFQDFLPMWVAYLSEEVKQREKTIIKAEERLARQKQKLKKIRGWISNG